MSEAGFEWDPAKDVTNQAKYAEDLVHSTEHERRYFCFGRCGGGVLTVRFTFRHEVIRIFGAGYWTRGLRFYEKTNQIHK
jgi:uncharacterized protein